MFKTQLILLAFCTAVSAQNSASVLFTIESAIENAMSRDHRVLAAEANVDSAATGISIARSGYFPNVQGSAGSGDQLSSSAYQLRASQMLYDWGQVKQRVNSRRAEHSQQREQLRLTRTEAALEVVGVYLDMTSSKQAIALYQELLTNLQGLHQLAEQRLSSGYSDRVEIDRTIIDMARAEEALAMHTGILLAAEQDFDELTGYSASGIQLLEPQPLQLLAILAEDHQPLDTLITESPEYQISRAEKALAQSELALSKAERMPKINLEASWERRDIAGQPQSDTTISVQFSYDMQQGLGSWLQPKKARSKLRAAEYASQAVHRDLKRSIRKLTTTEPVIKARMQSLQRQADSARTVKSSYSTQFMAGLSDLEDLLSIEREIFEAERQTIELSTQLIKDQYVLASQLGLLTRLLDPTIGER